MHTLLRVFSVLHVAKRCKTFLPTHFDLIDLAGLPCKPAHTHTHTLSLCSNQESARHARPHPAFLLFIIIFLFTILEDLWGRRCQSE